MVIFRPFYTSFVNVLYEQLRGSKVAMTWLLPGDSIHLQSPLNDPWHLFNVKSSLLIWSNSIRTKVHLRVQFGAVPVQAPASSLPVSSYLFSVELITPNYQIKHHSSHPRHELISLAIINGAGMRLFYCPVLVVEKATSAHLPLPCRHSRVRRNEAN